MRKYGLLSALSAQICSLSEKIVVDCLETSTGFDHALSSPAAAVVMLSVQDTAIASTPLNVWVPGRFGPRWAYSSREPLPHEKRPLVRRGPKATAGSPSETRPFS